MKRVSLLFFSLSIAMPFGLHGQAMIEYGLSAGRSTLGGAGAAKKIGDATGAVMSKTGQAVQKAGAANGKASSAPAAKPQTTVMRVETARSAGQPSAVSVPPPVRAEPPKPVDLTGIAPGLDRADLLAKAGKPSMKLTSSEGGEEVEKYWYPTTEGKAVITLRNGKVAVVSPPGVR